MKTNQNAPHKFIGIFNKYCKKFPPSKQICIQIPNELYILSHRANRVPAKLSVDKYKYGASVDTAEYNQKQLSHLSFG